MSLEYSFSKTPVHLAARSGSLLKFGIALTNAPGSPEVPKPRRQSSMGGLAHGLQFALMTMGGLAAGYWLDKHYLPMPLGTLGGLLTGSAAGMYLLARAVK